MQDINEEKFAEKKLRQHAEQMSALYDIGLTITSKFDLDHILHDLSEKCRRLLPLDRFYIAVYRESSGTIQHPLFYDGNQNTFIQIEDRSVKTDPGLSGYVILSKKTLYLSDSADLAIQEKYNIVPTGGIPSRSYGGVPMFFHDAVTGVISMQKFEVDAYSCKQIRLLETIATQAAIAIENAQLFQEQVRRSQIIEALADIANEIATTRDVMPVLEKITRRALDLLNANHVGIFLLQDDQVTLKPVVAHGTHQKELLDHTIGICQASASAPGARAKMYNNGIATKPATRPADNNNHGLIRAAFQPRSGNRAMWVICMAPSTTQPA